MITEWNIWNTQQFCQKYFEHRHRGLGVSFWYSPSLLSSGFGQPSGYSCVPQTLYKKEQSKDFDGKFLFLQSLTSLFIATWFPLHKTSVPPSFDTIEECITLEWANDVSIYQTNKRIHVMENWKMLAYKIKDLNMNPVRGLEIKILACPSKGLIWCPIWCPAVWLPIYNNVAEITRQLLCWWSLIWSSQRCNDVSLECLVSILLLVSMSVSQGCHNKALLKPQKCAVLRFLRIDIQNQGAGPAPSETSRGGSFLALSSFWWPQVSLGLWGNFTLRLYLHTIIFLLLHSPSVCLCPNCSPYTNKVIWTSS